MQNSWGRGWGTGGLALMTYRDWRENAMDCWVAQMGVVTALHVEIAESSTLRRVRGQIEVAADENLRNHEIAPYVVNMENNGKLSQSGNLRTSPGDLEALVTTYLGRARGVSLATAGRGYAISRTAGAVRSDAATPPRVDPASITEDLTDLSMWRPPSEHDATDQDIFEGLRAARACSAGGTKAERTLAKRERHLGGDEGNGGQSAARATRAVCLDKFATHRHRSTRRDRLHLMAFAGAIVSCYMTTRWSRAAGPSPCT